MESVQAFVGGKPILNRFACLKNEKFDPVSKEYVVKRRLIMDSKQSLVKDASNKEYRSILPLVSDACNDVLKLLDSACPGEQLGMRAAQGSTA